MVDCIKSENRGKILAVWQQLKQALMDRNQSLNKEKAAETEWQNENQSKMCYSLTMIYKDWS